MMKLIQKLIPVDDLKDTVIRFPLSVVCALALFVITVLTIHDVVDVDEAIIARIIVVLGSLYLWFGITRLIGESGVLRGVSVLILTVLGGAGIAALTFTGDIWWMHFWYLLPSLLLFLMFAPYLKGGDDLSVWFFNRKMWFGVLVSYVALLLLAGGLCTALWAIDILFGVDISHRLYSDIWALAALVVGPVYALSWVPKTFSFTKEDCKDPPGLKFIVNWISAPMALIYLLILYAYFIKIVVTGEVPNGYLAYMISGFVGAGVVTYLAAYPLREEGSPQLKLFYRIFFPALLVPVAFHFYAIWERVSAYGITEQRYMLLLLAIWFAFLAIGNIFWRLPIKTIPMVLAALLVLASFGPWGAVSVSAQSQFSRLQGLLVNTGLLVNGRIVKNMNADDTISFDDRQTISSILQYLCRTKRGEMIEGWFAGSEKFVCNAYKLAPERLGFEFVADYQREQSQDSENISLRGQGTNKAVLDVEGYRYLLRDQQVYIAGKPWEYRYPDSGISALYDHDRLVITVEGHGFVAFDILGFAKAEVERNAGRDARDMIMEAREGDLRVRIILNNINLKNNLKKLQEDRFELQSFNFQALVSY